jgi:hypothetical protein
MIKLINLCPPTLATLFQDNKQRKLNFGASYMYFLKNHAASEINLKVGSGSPTELKLDCSFNDMLVSHCTYTVHYV